LSGTFVPVAQLDLHSPLRSAVHSEVVQRLQELPIIVPQFIPFRLRRVEHLQHDLPVRLRHLRQRGRPLEVFNLGMNRRNAGSGIPRR
jgi:hypothetical protein